jgi:hypothetical protein
MAPAPDPADLFAAVTSLDRYLSGKASTLWRRLRPGALQESFRDDFVPEMLAATTEVQAAAADIGAGFVRRAVIASELEPGPLVNPDAFAGISSAGGDLAAELYSPMIGTYVDLAAGVETPVALSRGLASMDDAARMGSSVATVTTTEVRYYIRGVEPGACSRCILLSGKHYKVNAGFHRHPSCRCFHLPGVSIYENDALSESGSTVVDPQASPKQIFENLTPAERDAAFGRANAKAIRDGADMGRVVNATGSTAGMSTTVTDPLGRRLKATTIGARKGRVRLTPEGIYLQAGDDRAEAVRLLRVNGYLR